MKFDRIETISRSLVQHGPANDRVYLMKIHPEESVESLMDRLHDLALRKGYTKIFVKVPDSVHHLFLDYDLKIEAIVPQLYQGTEQGYFMGKYLNANRKFLTNNERKSIDEVKYTAMTAQKGLEQELATGYEIVRLGKQDIPTIAAIYRRVFQFYPFPIFEEAYIMETFHNHVQYYGVKYKREVIAVSSAEMDVASHNVEMTDFATLPKYRGRNLSYHLLSEMMICMAEKGMKTAYTIARSTSYGINKAFAREGFHFSGTLVNNTLIGDGIESMNVWHKHL